MTSLEQKVEQLAKQVKELKEGQRELKREVKKLKKVLILDATKVEVWIPIDKAPEYSISSFGRIRRRSDDYFPNIYVNRKTGYSTVRIDKKLYYLHRLIAQTFIPNPENKLEVDHIDGDRQNNNLSNLRWCTRAENSRNTKMRAHNTTGFTGTCLHKLTGKYMAYITIDKKRKHLGLFHTKKEASAAYEAAAEEAFGEFRRRRT